MALFKSLTKIALPFLFLLLAKSVFAQAPTPIPITDEPNTFQDLEKVFANFLAAIATLAGFGAFIMLIAGGFRYIIAQGDPKAVSAARSTITWAISGLIIVVLAWFIIQFIATFTGVEVTIFRIINPFTDDSI